MPRELQLARTIDRYGVTAVMGRSYLGVGEIRRMGYAENIVNWHRSRTQASDWAAWSKKYPGENAALVEAMKAASDG